MKCWQILLELNSKRLYESSGKERERRCLEFTSSTKQEIRHFHVVVVQWRQRNVQISLMHVQSCCFANLNLSLFCRSRCRRSRRLLKLRNLTVHEPDITLRQTPSAVFESPDCTTSFFYWKLSLSIITIFIFFFYLKGNWTKKLTSLTDCTSPKNIKEKIIFLFSITTFNWLQ